MAEKLDRKQWAKAVASRRTVASRPFSERIEKQKTASQPALSGLDWTKRVRQSREKTESGGRHRALVSPSKSSRQQRRTGGMLKSNQPQSRPDLTEAQRQALPKTGDQVPKKGINASNWAYDHRKATASRRNTPSAKTGEKKGINSEKWHYDHQKAKAEAKQISAKKSRPNTHTSLEKRRTQAEAIAKHQPRQPSRPKQPQAKPAAPAPKHSPRK